MAANNQGLSKYYVPPNVSKSTLILMPAPKKNSKKKRGSIRDNFELDDAVVQRSLAVINRGTQTEEAFRGTSHIIESDPWDFGRLKAEFVVDVAGVTRGTQTEEQCIPVTLSSIENHPIVKAHRNLQRRIAESDKRLEHLRQMRSQKMSSRECRPSDEYVVPGMPFCKFEESCLVCGKNEIPNEVKEEILFVASNVEDVLGKFIRRLNRKRISDLISSEYCGDAYPEALKTWSKRCLSILIGEIGYPETDEGLAEFWIDMQFLNRIPRIKVFLEQVGKML